MRRSFSPIPDRASFRRRAERGTLIPIHVEVLADLLTPIEAYRRLAGRGPAFLLESAEGGESVGRYSFIGVEPWETLRINGEDPLAVIEAKLAPYRPVRDPSLPRFTGGAVGYIGYDCVRYFEPRLARSGKLRGMAGASAGEECVDGQCEVP
ncbi:MAG: hypothetical protein D6679_14630, partial [Candidatus Hydrogenedentota bacterium]